MGVDQVGRSRGHGDGIRPSGGLATSTRSRYGCRVGEPSSAKRLDFRFRNDWGKWIAEEFAATAESLPWLGREFGDQTDDFFAMFGNDQGLSCALNHINQRQALGLKLGSGDLHMTSMTD